MVKVYGIGRGYIEDAFCRLKVVYFATHKGFKNKTYNWGVILLLYVKLGKVTPRAKLSGVNANYQAKELYQVFNPKIDSSVD